VGAWAGDAKVQLGGKTPRKKDNSERAQGFFGALMIGGFALGDHARRRQVTSRGISEEDSDFSHGEPPSAANLMFISRHHRSRVDTARANKKNSSRATNQVGYSVYVTRGERKM